MKIRSKKRKGQFECEGRLLECSLIYFFCTDSLPLALPLCLSVLACRFENICRCACGRTILSFRTCRFHYGDMTWPPGLVQCEGDNDAIVRQRRIQGRQKRKSWWSLLCFRRLSSRKACCHTNQRVVFDFGRPHPRSAVTQSHLSGAVRPSSSLGSVLIQSMLHHATPTAQGRAQTATKQLVLPAECIQAMVGRQPV